MPTSLADLLGNHLSRTHTSVNRLSRLSGVPQRTLANWLNGRIRKPQQWQAVVKAAAALHLTAAETDALLQSAGHPCIAELRQRADALSDQNILAPFSSETQRLNASAPPNSSPFQAIASLPTFVGRETESAIIRRALCNDGRAAIYGLHGMGGVGKTALAAHLAHQLRPDFPDGILWARLDTSDTMSILAAFAGAFGQDVSQLRDIDSRAAQVRSLLADKRALVVLDNAENSAQVRPLLPPGIGGCAVLITTRNDLSVADGWPRLTIEPFDPAGREALQLFEKYLGKAVVRQNRAALLEMATLLGHLPLALAITAGRLASQPGGTNAKVFLDALRQSTSRLDALARDDLAVRVSFDASYAALIGLQQSFFAGLGMFDGADFSLEAVAYLAEMTVAQVADQMQMFTSLSLAQAAGPDRYRLHPLLRDYARQKLHESGELPLKTERLLHLYQQVARGECPFACSLDAEMLNVRYALDQTANLGLQTVLLETVQALYPVWSANGWLALGLKYLPLARQAAQSLRDTEMEIRMMTWEAAFHNQVGAVDVARQLLQAARFMAQANGQVRELADILCGLGKLNYDQGQYDAAEPYYVQSLELARQSEYAFTLARNLNNLALIAHERANYAQAEAMFNEALEHFRSIHFTLGVNTVLMNLSNVYGALGDGERCMALRREALALARQENNRVLIVTILLNLADGYENFTGELDEAEQLLLEALDRSLELGAQRLESQVRVNYANILRRRRRFTESQQQITKSLALAGQLSDVETQVNLLRLQGELWLDMGLLADAASSLADALALAQNLHHQGMIARILYVQAQVLLEQGQISSARAIGMESLQIFARQGQSHQRGQVLRWLDSLPT